MSTNKREIEKHSISAMHKKFYNRILKQKKQYIQLKLVELSQGSEFNSDIKTVQFDDNSNKHSDHNEDFRAKLEHNLKQNYEEFAEMCNVLDELK